MYLKVWLLLQASYIFAKTNIAKQEAFAGQFPWVAAIYMTASDGVYFCGGSLITYQHILTAGQCVDR